MTNEILTLPEELREKIRRRAERAFLGFDAGKNDHITRCSDVARNSLRYRVPHDIAGTEGYYSGPQILVERLFRRKWWNPWSWSQAPEIIVPTQVSDLDNVTSDPRSSN